MEWPCRARGSGAGYAGVAVSGVSGACASTVIRVVQLLPPGSRVDPVEARAWWRSASGARRLASAGGSQSHTARTSLRARLFSVLFLISAPISVLFVWGRELEFFGFENFDQCRVLARQERPTPMNNLRCWDRRSEPWKSLGLIGLGRWVVA